MFFVKSFPDDFKGLERVVDGARVLHQTTQSILDSLTIDTNTVSFGRGERLCTTFLDTNYTATYRKSGIIFTLPEGLQPDYIFPFDLNCISQQHHPEVEYARMREKLQEHYGPEMIPGFKEFQCKNLEELKQKFGYNGIIEPKEVLKIVNTFREKHNRKPLLEEEHLNLFMYNEAIFLQPIKMVPVGIYGETEESKYRSKIYNLPLYTSAKDFFETLDAYIS